MKALVAKRGGGGEILIKRMLYLKIIESIGCQERGGGKILIKRMFHLLIIESIGCQERGGEILIKQGYQLSSREGGGGEILIKLSECFICIGSREGGGGEILIKRMLDLKMIE